jgi:hypothetical protein
MKNKYESDIYPYEQYPQKENKNAYSKQQEPISECLAYIIYQ